jgi:hypothetical protein
MTKIMNKVFEKIINKKFSEEDSDKKIWKKRKKSVGGPGAYLTGELASPAPTLAGTRARRGPAPPLPEELVGA